MKVSSVMRNCNNVRGSHHCSSFVGSELACLCGGCVTLISGQRLSGLRQPQMLQVGGVGGDEVDVLGSGHWGRASSVSATSPIVVVRFVSKKDAAVSAVWIERENSYRAITASDCCLRRPNRVKFQALLSDKIHVKASIC